jgi:transcriptional regulator with GAF, ATPase, and Fis domain
MRINVENTAVRKALPEIRRFRGGTNGMRLISTWYALAPRLRRAPPVSFSMNSIVVGPSARMRAVFDFVRVITDSESTVLITGETGTGKEVIARLIHHGSPRRHRPFVAVSCAILTESLIETELFGHERGAFTGAWTDRQGRFEMADGGTLFLDDVDDVPPSVQVKLLRALQDHTIERVGGTRAIPVNVRVITGTKRPLRNLVNAGQFRADLNYRLDVMPIWLPPLRQRREDIPVLTDHFIGRHFPSAKVPPISPAVREAFQRYPWPGNVRELENACERIAQTCSCAQVRSGCLPASILFHVDTPAPARSASATAVATHVGVSLDERLRNVEGSLIRWALRASDGNKSKAAELLTLSRSTLCDRIRRLQRFSGSADLSSAPDAAYPQ